LKRTRYRGLEKNTSQLFTLFGLANLMIAKKQLLYILRSVEGEKVCDISAVYTAICENNFTRRNDPEAYGPKTDRSARP